MISVSKTRQQHSRNLPQKSHYDGLEIIFININDHSLSSLSLFPMKPSRKFGFFSSSSSSTAVFFTYHDDDAAPRVQSNATRVPIDDSSSPHTAVPVTVQLPPQSQPTAAVKIQSAYRSYVIRNLYRRIATVNSEANQLERVIQRQDTVDAIMNHERERLKMNETLMALLLRLDSVPGIDPAVREARRKVSRRIVGLQEILDAICESKVNEDYWWGCDGSLMNWDEIMAEMEESVCRERGGEEMERFCAQHLGFRCLQRFLREA